MIAFLIDSIQDLCPNFKDLHESHKCNYSLYSESPIVKVVADSSILHFWCILVSKTEYLCLSAMSVCQCLSV